SLPHPHRTGEPAPAVPHGGARRPARAAARPAGHHRPSPPGERGGAAVTDLIDRVQRRLVDTPPAATDAAELARLIREEAGVISDVDVLDLLRRLRHDSTGIGLLESVLLTEGVTDILVNGPDQVWFDRGRGLERAEVRFTDDAEVRQLASRLASACGRRLDDAQPFA